MKFRTNIILVYYTLNLRNKSRTFKLCSRVAHRLTKLFATIWIPNKSTDETSRWKERLTLENYQRLKHKISIRDVKAKETEKFCNTTEYRVRVFIYMFYKSDYEKHVVSILPRTKVWKSSQIRKCNFCSIIRISATL